MTPRRRLEPTRAIPPPRRVRLATLVSGVVLVAVGAVGATAITGSKQRLDATAQQATGLAAQIQGECRAGTLAGPICQQAAQVVAEPIPGPAGAPGPAGRDGRDGVSPPCLSEPARCRGADGAVGPAGAAGKDGAPGKNGADGAQGSQGPAGRDGNPAAGFTMTFPDGTTQTCARSGGADTSPEYRCGAVQPAPADTQPPIEGGVAGG